MALRVVALDSCAVRFAPGDEVLLSGFAAKVLIRLVAEDGRPVDVDDIYRDVWLGCDDEKPVTAEDRNAVQQHIRTLRNALRLAAPFPQLPLGRRGSRGTYRLALDRHQVDVWEFLDMIAAAEQSEPAAAVDLLRRALAMWPDRPLPDAARDPFAQRLLDTLRKRHTYAVELSSRLHLGQSRGAVARDDLDGLAASVRDALHRQLRRDVGVAGYAGQSPLAVRFEEITLDGTAPWTATAAWGRSDRIGEMATRFRSLPRPRLVVLGGPGSGKTVLSMLLALELLRTWTPGMAVPVPLGLSSWRDGETVEAWIARRLGEDHPSLAGRVQRERLERLVAKGMVLPVLDGLDEVRPDRRSQVVEVLRSTLVDDGDGLIVTSRPGEYHHAAGDIAALEGATVIRALPLCADDIATYLDGPRWRDTVAALRRDEDPVLARALDTPWMCYLARVSGRRGRLVQPEQRTPEAIRACLTASLIPTVISVADLRRVRQGLPPHPDHAAASGALGFLARHAEAVGTPDIAWWRLYESVPWLAHRGLRAGVLGSVVATVAFLLIGVGTLATGGVTPWLVGGKLALGYGLASAVATYLAADLSRQDSRRRWRTALSAGGGAGLAFGLVAGIAELPKAWHFAVGYFLAYGLAIAALYALTIGVAGLLTTSVTPTRPSFRLRGRGRDLLRKLGMGLAGGVGVGLAIGLVEEAALQAALSAGLDLPNRRLVFGLLPGLAMGLLPGLAVGLIAWLRSEIAPAAAIRPEWTLRADRSTFLTVWGILTVAFVLSFTLGSIATTPDEVVAAAAQGLQMGVGGALVLGLVMTMCFAWPMHTAARLWHAAWGRLPWHYWRFMAQMRDLGLVRSVGAAFQFRHENLRRHLVDAAPPRA